MRVKLELTFDLPDYKENELPYLQQDLFDNLVNYSICKHLNDATEWMVEGSKAEGGRKVACAEIVKSHREWADKIRAAEKTMKIYIDKSVD